VNFLLNSSCLLGLLLALTSCGYSLRGSDSLAANFQSIQLNVEQSNGEFSRLLLRSLQSAGVDVELVNSEFSDSSPVLMVSNEQLVSRPVSINARSRAAQYELRLSVTIAMGNESTGYLIEPEPLIVQRIYFEDIENISGNREEVEIISAEMRRELVLQLMRRLESLEI
jgi:LPS-assembly lipoprotein